MVPGAIWTNIVEEADGRYLDERNPPKMRRAMRTVKSLTVTVIAFVSGWLLILTRGIFVAINERAHPDWYPVPSHPVARIATYLAIAISLQFLSGWLLTPSPAERSAAYWRRYAARVALCICGCFGAIVVILFVALMFCSDC